MTEPKVQKTLAEMDAISQHREKWMWRCGFAILWVPILSLFLTVASPTFAGIVFLFGESAAIFGFQWFGRGMTRAYDGD